MSKHRSTHTSVLCLSAVLLTLSLVAGGCDRDGHEGRVIAKVGDHEITADEFEAYLRFKRIVVRSEKAADAELKAYAERIALAEAALQSKLLDKADIQVELDEFKKEMLTSRYFETFLRTAVSHEDVERYYKEHASEYEDKRVHVAHILVRATRSVSEEDRKKAQEKIAAIKAELDAGKDFAELAGTLSEDRVTGNRGGDMGIIRQGAIDSRFSDAAFALGEGQVSEPVETPFGYHLIRVIEAPKVHTQPLSAVESDIRYKLRAAAKERESARLEAAVPVELKRGGFMPKQQVKRDPASAARAEK